MLEVSTNQQNNRCANCAAACVCLPVGLSIDEMLRLDQVVHRKRQVKRGDYLFEQHDVFTSFFAVSDGAFKTFSLTEDGREHINGFYLMGEIIGFDAVDDGVYADSAQALQGSIVCEISFDRLLKVAGDIPSLQRRIITLMSQRIRNNASVPSNAHAIEQVAAFILNISSRLGRFDATAGEFMMPMTRNDIGGYLGLAVETVSRVFTQLKDQDVIQSQGKRIVINNFRRLQQLACH